MKSLLPLIVLLLHQNSANYINENDLPEWSYIDETIDPCDNFYDFTCGNFKNVHEKMPQVGILSHFELLEADLVKIGHEILKEEPLLTDPKAVAKAKAVYAACTDTSLLNAIAAPELLTVAEFGGMPLIDNKQTTFTWLDLAQMVASYGLNLIFQFDVAPYSGNLTYIVLSGDSLTNPGLLRPEESNNYQEVIENDFKNCFEVNSTEPAPFDIFLQTLAKKLLLVANPNKTDAEMSADLQDMSDFMRALASGGNQNGYKQVQLEAPPTIQQLQEWTEAQFGRNIIDWLSFIRTIFQPAKIDITPETNIYLGVSVEQLYGILNLVQMTDDAIVKNFAFFRLFLFQAPDSDRLTRQAFDDYYQAKGYTLYPRWEYCTRKVMDIGNGPSLNFAVTFAFLRQYNPTNLQKVIEMKEAIEAQFIKFITESDWLDLESKRNVLNKLQQMLTMVAYPDLVASREELDQFYSNLNISTWNNYENAKQLRAFKQAYQLSQYSTSIKRNYWSKSTFDVNAVYNRPANRITIPFSVLNPSYFSGTNPLVDFGRLATILGHEMTHGYDVIGLGYNQNGLKEPLLTVQSTEAFEIKANCFKTQYSKYVVPQIDDRVNGEQTLNENLADNNGIRLSYAIFNDFITKTNLISNSSRYNLKQLFFIGYATVWCSSESDDYLRALLAKDVYPPNRFRVIGSLANFDEFGRAFNCRKSSTMNPYEQCRLF